MEADKESEEGKEEEAMKNKMYTEEGEEQEKEAEDEEDEEQRQRQRQ